MAAHRRRLANRNRLCPGWHDLSHGLFAIRIPILGFHEVSRDKTESPAGPAVESQRLRATDCYGHVGDLATDQRRKRDTEQAVLGFDTS